MARSKKSENEVAPTSLKAKLLKNSKISETAELADSHLFDEKDIVSTDTPALNIALSGSIDGGLVPGILQIAAESKHFKSKFALKIAKHFLQRFDEGVVLFYDSEYGTPESYFYDMKTENIIHCPILDLEQFKTDIVVQLKGINKGEKLLIILDSLGNIPSIKELTDTETGKGTKDMTRAAEFKSLFRMIMPLINQKEVYMIVVNHTYQTMEFNSKTVPNGGAGALYNSNVLWTISKAREVEEEKNKKVLTGFQFTINMFKSRFVKESAKIPITVKFDGGIDRWSGIFDIACNAGIILNKNAQTYYLFDRTPDDTFKRSDVEEDDEFMNNLIKYPEFNEYVKKEFQF